MYLFGGHPTLVPIVHNKEFMMTYDIMKDNEGFTAQDTWDIQGIPYRVEMLTRAGLSPYAARHDHMPDDPEGRLECLLCGH